MAGLSSRPLSIPSKYFYDDIGSSLFDQITDLPEYYLTRSEQALLDRVSDEIASLARATRIVELGSGTARKTRTLIRALKTRVDHLLYTPVDISRYALAAAAASVARDIPGVEVRGIQCDYTASLDPLEPDPGSLAVFLGSTVGNFTHGKAVRLLRRLRERLHPGDAFLLGVDLVKPVEILELAYNDHRGVTAEFNRNILRVVNRLADGDFDPEAFEHLAFFDVRESQIEMHLVARRAVRVRLPRFELELEVDAGERIRTEISRKFTRASCSDLLAESGFRLERWFVSSDDYFALALARVAEDSVDAGRAIRGRGQLADATHHGGQTVAPGG